MELTELLRFLTLCMLFSKKPFAVFLETAGYIHEDVFLQKPKAGVGAVVFGFDRYFILLFHSRWFHGSQELGAFTCIFICFSSRFYLSRRVQDVTVLGSVFVFIHREFEIKRCNLSNVVLQLKALGRIPILLMSGRLLMHVDYEEKISPLLIFARELYLNQFQINI